MATLLAVGKEKKKTVSTVDEVGRTEMEPVVVVRVGDTRKRKGLVVV